MNTLICVVRPLVPAVLVYAVLGSTNLADWTELGIVTNSLGNIVFTDVAAHLSPMKFYRARLAP